MQQLLDIQPCGWCNVELLSEWWGHLCKLRRCFVFLITIFVLVSEIEELVCMVFVKARTSVVLGSFARELTQPGLTELLGICQKLFP
jgi:hypothetical protein